MASAIKLLIEVLGGFLLGFLKGSGEVIVRTHEGLESAFDSAITGISELLFEAPIHCFDDQCLAGTLATATMWSVAIFLVMACFERFRWSQAFTGLILVFLCICLLGQAAGRI